jgi:hypothetical protein
MSPATSIDKARRLVDVHALQITRQRALIATLKEYGQPTEEEEHALEEAEKNQQRYLSELDALSETQVPR